MLRVTTVRDETGATTLVVEGRLTGKTMHEIDTLCAQHLNHYAAATIDVAGLTYTDGAGAGALHRARRAGASVVGASPFLEEMLRSEEGDDRRPVEVHPTMPAPTVEDSAEDTLLTQLRAGDDGAYETLVRRYGGRMLATARRIVRNDEEAEDVVQEAYLSAFKAIGSFSGGSRLSTWLHRIVVNAALMRVRSRRRRPERPIDELLPRFADDGHFAEPPSAWGRNAAELLDSQQMRALVRRAIDELPETYRTVVLLRDIEGLDTEETAAVLGVSANAVKVRLHRARQALRTLIDREIAPA